VKKMAISKEELEAYKARKKKIREYYEFLKNKKNKQLQEIYHKIIVEHELMDEKNNDEEK